jgi:hypothetical protein
VVPSSLEQVIEQLLDPPVPLYLFFNNRKVGMLRGCGCHAELLRDAVTGQGMTWTLGQLPRSAIGYTRAEFSQLAGHLTDGMVPPCRGSDTLTPAYLTPCAGLVLC